MGDFDGRSMGAFTDYIPDTKDFPEAPNLEPAADVGLLVETNSGNKTNVTTKGMSGKLIAPDSHRNVTVHK